MAEIAEFTRHLGHYLAAPEVALVERAFEFSERAHRGQFRKSGEPYITHPLAVASILSQWRLDAEGLAAALLHDVTEDTSVTRGELEHTLGKPVADMVDGLSKLDQLELASRARRSTSTRPSPTGSGSTRCSSSCRTSRSSTCIRCATASWRRRSRRRAAIAAR